VGIENQSTEERRPLEDKALQRHSEYIHGKWIAIDKLCRVNAQEVSLLSLGTIKIAYLRLWVVTVRGGCAKIT
jgi:hypothetical protein